MTSLKDYRLPGNSGLRVSPLCPGTMTFGTEWGWGSTEKVSRSILQTYLDHGGNFIDTANYYTNGTSETLIGKFLKGIRDRVVPGSKYSLNMYRGDPNAGGNHRKNLIQSLDASLKCLQTDYIDLYWVHICDQVTPVEEVMRALDDAVKAGKILYVGVSDMPAWKIARGNTLAVLKGWTPFIALQIEYSLIQRTVERDLVPMACDMGLGVMPWSPLGAALLSGKYTRKDLNFAHKNPDKYASGKNDRPVIKRLTERNIKIAEEVIDIARESGVTPSQVALSWLINRQGVSSIIIGARRIKQIKENIGCLSVNLNDDQIQRLNNVSKIDLGFPHDFIGREVIKDLVTGGTHIRFKHKQLL